MAGLPSTFEEQNSRVSKRLNDAIDSASKIINKSYMEDLEHMKVVPIGNELENIDVSKCSTFYRLNKLVLNREENFLDKLTTIANIAANTNGTLATIIDSDGIKIDYYIGILSKNNRMDNKGNNAIRQAAADAFSGAIEGNFAGSELKRMNDEDIKELNIKISGDNIKSVSSISGIVALRNKNNDNILSYVQGIENLVNAVKGKKYSIVMIADPVSSSKILNIKSGYEMMHTQLSCFLKNVLTVSENESKTLSESRSSAISKGITEGIARTTTNSSFESKNNSFNLGITVAPFGIGGNAGVSFGHSRGTSTAESYGKSNSVSQMSSKSTSFSSGNSKGSGRSIQFSYENRTVKDLLDKIDLHIKRLDMCESLGAFECCTYVLAENKEDVLCVSSNYSALMRGEDSFVEASQINTWNKPIYDKNDSWGNIIGYLKAFTHPRFYMDNNEKFIVSPCSVVNGREIAIQFGLPKKSINGLTVIEMAPFGRNIEYKGNNSIDVGHVYYMGKDDGTKMRLDINSLASHTFISGATGSGKSNAIYNIIDELVKKNVSFMVIEPAKGEYKNVFGNRSNVTVLGTNPKYTRLLKINPFKFHDNIHVLEHIDRLVEIFNVCWPMYAAMPAVLKDALIGSYEVCGWDMSESVNRYGLDLYPTFSDLLSSLDTVIDSSGYSEEVKSNYRGSLITRVKSLTNGLNGQIFSGNEIDSEELFDKNVIVDLSRIGSIETKSLIMGILVMRLSEYRMARAESMNVPLKHITVLEEAHNILKRTSTEQNSENPNVTGKSVELISNAIAEMRTYGEGFIIADQSPSAVDISAIRNTNTKIIMRLPDEIDRRILGKAAALRDNQLDEIAKLPMGTAVVYQNDWLEPILCKVNKFDVNEISYKYERKTSIREESKKAAFILINFILKNRLDNPDKLKYDQIVKSIENCECCSKVKIRLNLLADEFKMNGKIRLWDKTRFSEQAHLVEDILEMNKVVESMLSVSSDMVDFNYSLNTMVAQKLSDVNDEILLGIKHCLMKTYSENNVDNVENYKKWYDEIVERSRML